MAQYEIKGLKEFEAAIRRNPRYVIDRANVFLVRSLAEYRRVIVNNPWTIHSSGGGAPVRTHNLRDTHRTTVSTLEGRIGPDQGAAPYARFVHWGTRKMRARPWLDYAADTARPLVEMHERALLEGIVKNLAS